MVVLEGAVIDRYSIFEKNDGLISSLECNIWRSDGLRGCLWLDSSWY